MARLNNKNKPAYDKPNTIIGEGVVVNAELLESKTPVQIAGKFNGNMSVASSLVITEKGEVVGNVKANFLLVAGVIKGNIDVEEQLHMTATGKIIGDIICKSVVIDEGAQMNGNCKMKAEPRQTSEQRNHKKA